MWQTMHARRCSVHKTANVLAKLPKREQPKAKRALQEIWMAETKGDAEAAFEALIVKYEKPAECLNKDHDALLTFYDFPAEHWKHSQITNPSKARSQPCAIARSARRHRRVPRRCPKAGLRAFDQGPWLRGLAGRSAGRRRAPVGTK
jgi:transposase-like protein